MEPPSHPELEHVDVSLNSFSRLRTVKQIRNYCVTSVESRSRYLFKVGQSGEGGSASEL